MAHIIFAALHWLHVLATIKLGKHIFNQGHTLLSFEAAFSRVERGQSFRRQGTAQEFGGKQTCRRFGSFRLAPKGASDPRRARARRAARGSLRAAPGRTRGACANASSAFPVVPLVV